MPDWKSVLTEVAAAGSGHDLIRRKYLRRLSKLTGRNTISYYSGWLQKPELEKHGISFALTDADKGAFMAVVHGLDRKQGLDLLLHTPGGSIAATESLVDYLRQMFGKNIRAVIPQIAMSAGTMIALSCKQILMGKHSSLGPIDPQYGGIPAHGIIEEFTTAKKEVKADPGTIPLWQALLAKYEPSLIGECQKAIAWSDRMVQEWLETCMFESRSDPTADARKVVREFGDHALTLSHSRHVSIDMARKAGVEIIALETDQKLQDAVLSVHHANILTLTATNAIKLVENQKGVASLVVAQMIAQVR